MQATIVIVYVLLASIHDARMQLQNEGIQQRSSNCFGQIIQASCSSNENVFPINVEVGVKPSSKNCTAGTCCTPDSDDCTGKFIRVVDEVDTAGNFYEDCIGRETGLQRQAGWADTLKLSCPNSTSYPGQTQYMYIDYYCVDESRIGRFPSTSLNVATGEKLYLQGSQYPNSISQTALTCSVETDCDATITVLALHVMFTNSSDGSCKQSITFNDTSGYKYVSTCDDNSDNNEYNLRNTLTTSVKNYMHISYSSTAINEGKFWFGFKTSSNGNLTIDCPSNTPQINCEEPTTTTTEPTTTTTEPTTTTTEPTTTTTEPTTTTTTTEPTTTTTTEPTTTSTEPTTTTTETSTISETTEMFNSSTKITAFFPEKEGEASSFPIVVVIVPVILLVAGVIAFIGFRKRKQIKQRCSRNKVDAEKQNIISSGEIVSVDHEHKSNETSPKHQDPYKVDDPDQNEQVTSNPSEVKHLQSTPSCSDEPKRRDVESPDTKTDLDSKNDKTDKIVLENDNTNEKVLESGIKSETEIEDIPLIENDSRIELKPGTLETENTHQSTVDTGQSVDVQQSSVQYNQYLTDDRIHDNLNPEQDQVQSTEQIYDDANENADQTISDNIRRDGAHQESSEEVQYPNTQDQLSLDNKQSTLVEHDNVNEAEISTTPGNIITPIPTPIVIPDADSGNKVEGGSKITEQSLTVMPDTHTRDADDQKIDKETEEQIKEIVSNVDNPLLSTKHKEIAIIDTDISQNQIGGEEMKDSHTTADENTKKKKKKKRKQDGNVTNDRNEIIDEQITGDLPQSFDKNNPSETVSRQVEQNNPSETVSRQVERNENGEINNEIYHIEMNSADNEETRKHRKKKKRKKHKVKKFPGHPVNDDVNTVQADE